jgi:serine O-acetyltransferase
MLGESDQNPAGISLPALLFEDLRTHGMDPLQPGFIAVALHRLGNARMRVQPRALRMPLSLAYRAAHGFVNLTLGIDLPYTVRLGRRVRIWHHGGIVINAFSIGDDCHFRHNTTLGVQRTGDAPSRIPTLGNNVDVGVGAVVLGPIHVGSNVRIGANSVVRADVASGTTISGVSSFVVDRSGTQRNPNG